MCSIILQIGTRNKTVLNNVFGNSVFHLPIGTRNKTVPNNVFGNNVFHLQIRTRNTEQNSPKLLIWKRCVPFTEGTSEQNSRNLSI